MKKESPVKVAWIFFLVLTSLFLGACENQVKEIPQGIFGMWKTSDPRYKDRFFRLDRETLTIGVGEGRSFTYPISRIRLETQGKRTLITVLYKDDEGAELTVSFYYEPQNGGTLFFRHQEGIKWTKG